MMVCCMLYSLYMIPPIQEVAKRLLAQGKGLLAADESIGSMNGRLAALGIEQSESMRRAYRDLLFSTPRIEEYLTGVILVDETLRQSGSEGGLFTHVLESRGIIPGIKVDKGKVPLPNFPGEEITEGLDGLRERLAEYYTLGARFTKWRAVIVIGENLPTYDAVRANAHVLARYAALVQEAHMVPVIEPEVLYDGAHSIERCEEVLRLTFDTCFAELDTHRVALNGVILKTSMALPGKESGHDASPTEVAVITSRVLKSAVPPSLAGVVFLSGGQTPKQATENLNAIAQAGPYPWPVTFSYSRAVQEPALHDWGGNEKNKRYAQEAFAHRLAMNALAQQGHYDREADS